jgi:3-oxoacyl-ACP reductase-like protein
MLEVRLEPESGLSGGSAQGEPIGLRQSVRETILTQLHSVECPCGCRKPYLTVIVNGNWSAGEFWLEAIQACCLAHAAVATEQLEPLVPFTHTASGGAYLS